MADTASPGPESRPKPGRERGFVLLLVLVALAVRLLFYIYAYDTPLFHAPMVDESWHNKWANELLDNGWDYPQVFFRAPLYPYTLTVLYAVSDRSVAFARAAQLGISVCSVVLFYFLALRFLNQKQARVAALVLSVYGTTIWYEQALLIPVLIIFLNLLLLYLLDLYRTSGRSILLPMAGLVSGLSLIARPNIAIFVIGVGIYLFLHKRNHVPSALRIKRTLIYWGVALLPIIPVAAHNYAYSGDFIPIASQGGINFYLGNNPEADGLTMLMPEIAIDQSMSWDEFVPTTDSIAHELSGRILSPGEISSFWTRKFIRYVFAHPVDFAGGLLKKTYFFFAGAENSDNFDLYFYRKLNPVYAALVWRYGLHFPYGVVAPLAILGLVWLWPRRRDWALPYLFVALYAPTVIGVLVTARHRLPVVPLLILFAVWGGTTLYQKLREGTGRTRVIVGTAALALFIGSNVELFYLGFQNDQQSHINLALAYKKMGDTEHSVAHLDSALAIDSASIVGLNNRGIAFMDDGDLYMAKHMFRLALSLDHGSMTIRNNLATVMMKQGAWESAMAIYREVMIMAGEIPEPFFNVARIYGQQGRIDSALAYYDSALVRDPEFVEAINNKGSLMLSVGDTASAEQYWRDAVTTDPTYPTAAMNLVRLYRDRGEAEKAQGVLQRARSPWQGSADWYYASAQVALDQSDSAEARRLLSESIQRHRDHRPTQFLARRLLTH